MAFSASKILAPGYQAGSETVTSSGTTTLEVPASVYSMTYDLWGGGGGVTNGDGSGSSASQQSTGTFSVVPYETLTLVTAANSSGNTTTSVKRGATVLASATGSVTSYPNPVYSVDSTLSTNVHTFSGNVDATLRIAIRVIGTGSLSSTSGTSGTLESAASSNGCSYDEYHESSHGDLSATITINEINTHDTSKYQTAYVASSSGRNTHANNPIFHQYPLSSNGYIAKYDIGDGDYSEGNYSVRLGVKEGFGNTNGQGYIKLTW